MLESFCTLVGEQRAQQAVGFYRERYSEIGWKENTAYPGMVETLAKLAETPLPMFVATSKPLVYARRIVEYFELMPYFKQIFGSELDGTRADKSDLLRFALSETDATANSTMIGDRKHDVTGALNNSLNTIGVTCGYGTIGELEEAGVHRTADRPEDLLALLL